MLSATSLVQLPENSVKSALPLRRALLLSVSLHALALTAFSDPPVVAFSGVAPMERLQVSVRAARLAAQSDAGSVAREPPAASRRRLERSEPRREDAARQPAVSPAPTLAMDSATAPVPPLAAIPGGIPQAAPAAPVSAAVASPEETPGVDAAGLRAFRLALASEARRVRNYPEAARRAGIVGVSEIRISVDAQAQRRAELARSSGHAILDEAALGMLRIAAERSPLPASLRGREFAILLPVVFEIEEAE